MFWLWASAWLLVGHIIASACWLSSGRPNGWAAAFTTLTFTLLWPVVLAYVLIITQKRRQHRGHRDP